MLWISGGKMVGNWKQEYDDHIQWQDSCGYGWNRENPTTGYDHRIPASNFLPLSHRNRSVGFHLVT